MLQSIKNEATKSEDMFMQLQEIQESVRLAFLNCFLDFAGMLDLVNLMPNCVPFQVNKIKENRR